MKSRLLLLVILLAGCGRSQLNVESDLPSSAPVNNSQLTLEFLSPKPDATFTSGTDMDVEIKVDPIENLKSLSLIVEDKPIFNFTDFPFKTRFKVPAALTQLRIVVVAKALDDSTTRKELILKKDTTPAPTPPAIASGGDGVIDSTCMTNTVYDACIFKKNPVAQKGSSFSPSLAPGADLSTIQTYGVKLRRVMGGELANGTVRIMAGSKGTTRVSQSEWKTAYQNDAQTHYVTQISLYYWLNYLEENITQRTGTFYAANKNIPINSYHNVADNAYWDGSKIVLGYNSTLREVGLGGEVAIHEMGHANFEFAMGSPAITSTCNTAKGCTYAIHEGQSDFLAALIFPDKPAMGETFMNSVAGMPGRNVASLNSLTAQAAFTQFSGEPHGMGTVYSSALWMLYNHSQMNKKDFEAMFMAHLSKLTGASNFCSGRQALLAEDLAHYGEKYKSIINEVFTAKGLSSTVCP